MNTDSLTGKSVVVTRASHQSGELITALRETGAEVVPAPAIAVVPPLDGGQPLDDALLRLERFSWIAFTSSNAVSALMARAARRGVLKKFDGLRLAAIGPSTASKVLSELKREPDLVPSKNDGLSLAQAFPAPTPDDHVLVPMASDGRPELSDTLESKGWKVNRVAAYRTVFPSLADDVVKRAIKADVVTFASPSAVKGHIEQTGGRTASKIVAIGQTTAEECRVQGLEVAGVAESQTTEGLIRAVIGVLD